MWARLRVFFNFLANLMNGLFKDVNGNDVRKLKLYLEENRALKVINHWKNNRNYFVVYVKFWLHRLIIDK